MTRGAKSVLQTVLVGMLAVAIFAWLLSLVGAVPNVGFSNLTPAGPTANIGANGSILLNVTNGDNVSRIYNFSVELPPNTTAWLNGSAALSLVSISAGGGTTLNLTMMGNTTGVYFFNVTATRADNGSEVKSSALDLMLNLTVVDFDVDNDGYNSTAYGGTD